jgi:hypothetical protein
MSSFSNTSKKTSVKSIHFISCDCYFFKYIDMDRKIKMKNHHVLQLVIGSFLSEKKHAPYGNTEFALISKNNILKRS